MDFKWIINYSKSNNLIKFNPFDFNKYQMNARLLIRVIQLNLNQVKYQTI